MEDKGLDFAKPPLEPDLPSINRSVARSCFMREAGTRSKSNSVPTELKWAAEDNLVSKNLEEYKCKLPDVPRSTFLMVFSPDGKKVASTHGNHNVYVTDLTSGKNIKTLTGHPRTPWCIAFHPSSNQILASGCLGGQVRVWDLSGGSEIWMAESHTVIASLAFHPIDRMLVIASYNELHFWDWSQPEPFAKCFTANEKEKVRYVAFDALGHKLITGVANAPARPASQWDRVAAPQPPPPSRELDSERRITICYRYMVEQYEQLVERYFDLSRVRNTLTMDRGTDPMDFEGDASSDSRSTAPDTNSRPFGPRPSQSPCRNSSFPGPSTSRLSSGTDEASASHSSTNFLTPTVVTPLTSPPVTQPLLTSSSDTSAENGSSPRNEAPRRTIRFDIKIPSFYNLRLRSSSLPSSTCSQNQASPSRNSTETTRTRPLSLSPDNSGFRLNENATPVQNNDVENGEEPNTVEPCPSTPNLLTNMPSWTNRSNPSDGTGTSTEVNDSENEEQGEYEELQTESQSDDVPHSSTSRSNFPQNTNSSRSPRNSESSPRRLPEASAVSQLRSQFHRLQSAYENRNSTQSSNSHVFSPEQNLERNRIWAVLDRLWDDMIDHNIVDQSALRPRVNNLLTSRRSAFQPHSPTTSTTTATTTTASAAGSAASRTLSGPAPRNTPLDFYRVLSRLRNSQSLDLTQVLNNLEEIIRRPDLRVRRQYTRYTRRVTVMPRIVPPQHTPAPTTSSDVAASNPATPTPDIIGGVRHGIQLLSRHIDNMQLVCRARLEVLQLQQIRRMWEDLQSQIYALHGAVREGEGGTPEPSTSQQTADAASTSTATPTASTATATTSTDLLTDDDSDNPSSVGDFHWRLRRTPQTSSRPRPLNKSFAPRPPRIPPVKRSRPWFNRPNDNNRRCTLPQVDSSRSKPPTRQTSSSTQEERGEASSSHVSGETSTGTSDEPAARVRGVKRKSRDSDTLFRPRPSSSSTSQPQPSANISPESSLLTIMRGLINQLEHMGQRSRYGNPQRNIRMSRFTRQREERRMRNLWDTESSHESSRDDQSEGDSSQPSTPEGLDATDSELTGESTTIRARQVLHLMVNSLMQFFENDSLPQRSTNEALNERIQNLFTLLQLALNLTDLLLAQLVNSRREVDAMRPVVECVGYVPPRRAGGRRPLRIPRIGRFMTWRRLFTRNPQVVPPSTPLTVTRPTTGPPATTPTASSMLTPTPSRNIPPNTRLSYLFPSRQVPIVRVNDMPAPPPEAVPAPRFRPHSPPPVGPSPMFVPARFLHPARYGYSVEESTSEDSSPHDRSTDFFFIRDTPMSPHHRIQAWDFSRYNLPDLGNSDKNIVVSECKIHNDASVDVSVDGRLLVTLLPSGRLSMTTLLGIYSLQWSTLGQLLYTTSFEQSIVSVSLSPTSRHLVVGLASRRVALYSSERHANAQVFRLEGASLGRKAPLAARGRLVHLRDLELGRHPVTLMSLNCIRWAPNPGQGLVYGTNTGQLKVLR